jgi:membrane protease YdiL (CAAX protease family)
LVVCAIAMAAMLAAGLVIGVIATTAAIAAGHSPEVLKANPRALPLFSSPVWIAAGTLANESAVAITLLVAIRWLKPPEERVLPLRLPAPSSIFAALLVVFGAAPFADAAAELCHRAVGSDLTATELVSTAARAAGPGTLVLLIFALAVVPAVVEESMFRGFITAAFPKSKVAAFVWPTLLFGAFHLEPTQAVGTVVLGAGFALARLWTGSLIPGIVVHAVYNAAVILAVRYGESPEPGKAIELVPLAAGFGVSALGVALLARARRRALDQPLTAS